MLCRIGYHIQIRDPQHFVYLFADAQLFQCMSGARHSILLLDYMMINMVTCSAQVNIPLI